MPVPMGSRRSDAAGAGPARAAVLGIGNVLMGDDGFGPYVVRVLEASCTFPPEVLLADLGTPGPDLAGYLEGLDLAVFVDTVNVIGRPGDLRVLTGQDFVRHGPPVRLGPHDPNLKEVLLEEAFRGTLPRTVRLVGAIPHRIRTGPGLSPPVRGAVPHAAEVVLGELARHGFAVALRARPLSPDIWWEPSRSPRTLSLAG